VRILLTNDDGIHAEGLTALERIAAQLSDDVWICAPEPKPIAKTATRAAPKTASKTGAKTSAKSKA
jgi:5'-nucleotidase